MAQGKAEDAGGLTPAKDDNTALCHFGHRTLPIFKCVDYKGGPQPPSGRGWHGAAVAGGIPFIDGLPEHGIPPPPPSAAVPLPLAREAWGAPLSSPAGKGPLAKGGFGVLPLPRTRKASRICGISVIKQAFPLPFRRKMWYTAFYPK